MLNRFLVEMSKVVVRHGGTIDKFMGDSIMVLFGAPEAAADDVTRAMDCAVDMQIAMAGLNRHQREIGLPPLYMGIGVNTGIVMAGMLGSELYSQYTVVGDEVNLASRIEAVSLRGQVLISERTFGYCRDYVSTGAATDVYVKGKAEPVKLYEVLGIPSAGKVLPRQELRKSPRVEAKLPFAYQLIDNGVVRPELLRGSTLDIGYYGLLVEVERPLVERSEIKFELALPLIDATAGPIYAHVVKTRQRDARHLAALEFTSLGERAAAALRRFVQLLLQGA
jgi:adenylate cyclase